MAITEHGLAAEAVARPQRWRRGDAPTVALHWLVALLLLVSLATGFRVAADALEAGWWRGVAARIAPQGAVLLWHIASACALLAAAAGYVTFLVRARQVGRVRLDARRRACLRSPDARRRWKAVNVLIYWLAFGLVFAAGTTGLLMYSDLVNRAEWHLSHLHRWIAWSLAGYVVLHVSAQLALDGWRALYAILVPRRSFGVAAAAAGAALALAAVGVLTIDWLTVRTLAVGKVQDVPRIDGAFDDPAWQDAHAVTIETAGGANLFSGGTTVTVRAVHDDTDAYFLFEWRDPTRSLTHLPLQKTAAGWRMVQNGFYRADETDFYEDKFAVMLSNADRFAALRATHLGPRPVETLPGASGQRGLHYTDDGSVLDVWHWMAVRTDPLGQAEDDYFGPLRLPSDSPLDRYAGGYAPDPGAGGGSLQNWRDLLEGPISRRIDGGVVPRFLPADPSVLARYGKVDVDPASSDEAPLWLPAEEARPYSSELDATFPDGSIVPSVMVRRPIEGDRADVAAVGRWSDGLWRLEMKRALDTGSTYDVALGDGTYLWVAVFDHTQTRHSWHMRPLRLRME